MAARHRRSPHSIVPEWLAAPWSIGALTGAALLLSFPPLGWSGTAWVAAAPLMAALQSRPVPSRTWLGAGWGLGLVYYAAQYAWVGHAMVELAGVGFAAFCTFYMALAAALALVPALGLALCAWLRGRWGVHTGLSLAVAWAAQDWLLGVLPFHGLAWGSLAGPQAASAAGAVAPVLGGSGVVLVLASANAAWAEWLLRVPRATGEAPRDAAGGVAVGGVAAWGFAGGVLATATLALALPWSPAASSRAPTFSALLVPGQLPAGGSAPDPSGAALRGFLSRSMLALEREPAPRGTWPRLVVWPESAVPGRVTDGDTLVSLSRVGTLLDADFLLGSDAADPGREYNSLFLVTGQRFDFLRYDKRSRVPFGEYVPRGFGWIFGRKLTAGEQDYAEGAQPPVLDWRGIPLGVATCFESILPRHAGLVADLGAQALVVAANDAWLTPAAQEQHLWLTALRGREIARDVLFVSNGGFTGLLRNGRPVQLTPARTAPLWVQAELSQDLTPWVRWRPWPLTGAGLALCACAWWLRRRAAEAGLRHRGRR